MNSEAKSLYRTVMEYAERMEHSIMRSKMNQESIKDAIKIDLRDFLIFIAIADRTIARDELKYINKSLGYDFSADSLMRYISTTDIASDHFLNRPPASLSYFLGTRPEDLGLGESKYYELDKLYYLLFRTIGEDFLSSCKHVDTTEINQLTRYLFMLESNINSRRKNKGSTPARPDKIPFKCKEDVNRAEQIDNSPAQTETTFIGTISGGDTTIQDLDGLLQQLDSLIGLASVKEEVHDLINLLKIIELRKQNGLKAPAVTKHFVFSGNPGTGKTTVARLLSQIYCSLGILSKGHMVEVDRSGLVAGYMGQTAIKVKEVIDKAIGGVLFIDEAYALANDNPGGDFGQEAIDTLVKAMEDNRDDLIVIVAGYPDLMDNFIAANPGLKSRFQKNLFFPDYDADELFEVFEKFAHENDYKLTPEAAQYLKEQLVIYTEHKADDFGNARDMRNFLDFAISAQANRLLKEGVGHPDALMTIATSDLKVGFEQGA